MSTMAINGGMNGASRTIRTPAPASASEPKDAALLERFLQIGDEDAFAGLVKRHGPLVRSVCARFLTDRRDIEDVFQATFIVLASRAGTIRKMDSIASWLYGVAMRLARKVQVRSSRRKQHETRVAAGKRKEETPPDAGWREVCAILYEELNRLPDRQRIPLLLCYWEGMSQDEAAQQLGLPRGTLKRRLESGRNKLRERLAGRGIGLSAVLLAVMLSERKLFAIVPSRLVARTVHNAVAGRVAGAATGGLSSRAALLAGGMSVLTRALQLKAVMALLMVSGVLAVPMYYTLPAVLQADEPALNITTTAGTPASSTSNRSRPAPAPAASGDLPAPRAPLRGPHPHGVM